MKTKMNNLQALAADVRSRFTCKERKDGETFYCIKDNDRDPWIVDLCHDAHGDMFPDDFKYECIVNALETIRDYDDPERGADELEPDCYNSDLYKWLQSNTGRADYVDEWVSNCGHGPSIVDDIMGGQLEEKREVFYSVLQTLRARLESEDKDPDEDAEPEQDAAVNG